MWCHWECVIVISHTKLHIIVWLFVSRWKWQIVIPLPLLSYELSVSIKDCQCHCQEKKSWTFLACSLGCLVCNTRLIDNVSSNPIVPIQLFGINNVKLKINNQIWFLLKNHTQKVVEKLFAYPFLKIKNWAYLWI